MPNTTPITVTNTSYRCWWPDKPHTYSTERKPMIAISIYTILNRLLIGYSEIKNYSDIDSVNCEGDVGLGQSALVPRLRHWGLD